MNRAASTRLRNRIEVLRCPVCNRLAVEPEPPVPSKDNFPATSEELQEIHSIFANAAERKVEVAPALCEKCRRPLVQGQSLEQLTEGLIPLVRAFPRQNPVSDPIRSGIGL